MTDKMETKVVTAKQLIDVVGAISGTMSALFKVLVDEAGLDHNKISGALQKLADEDESPQGLQRSILAALATGFRKGTLPPSPPLTVILGGKDLDGQ
ncbi:MAG TPA: hypothetical protein VJQ06_02035 [Rhizomicrobium sp.]|nr:hypothetical protein [Rhizomicrobium sp.]